MKNPQKNNASLSKIESFCKISLLHLCKKFQGPLEKLCQGSQIPMCLAPGMQSISGMGSVEKWIQMSRVIRGCIFCGQSIFIIRLGSQNWHNLINCCRVTRNFFPVSNPKKNQLFQGQLFFGVIGPIIYQKFQSETYLTFCSAFRGCQRVDISFSHKIICV